MSKAVNSYKYFAVLTICLLILGFYNKDTVAAYEEGEVSNGGTIVGTVKFDSDVPEVRMLDVDKDKEACGHDPLPSETLVVSEDKAVKNAVISISGISKGKKYDRSGGNPAIDQKGCVFIPHVTVVPPGSTVDLLNSDDVMHNLHTWSIKNTAFNEGVAGGGKLPKTFKHSETIKITCDVHKWMSAWLIVQDNPYYAITNEDGKFQIGDIPPGTYVVQAWQESLGKVTQEVTVKAGETTKADFEMTARKERERRRKKE
jgi:plastocyanin